jgi:prephenate dehydratase
MNEQTFDPTNLPSFIQISESYPSEPKHTLYIFFIQYPGHDDDAYCMKITPDGTHTYSKRWAYTDTYKPISKTTYWKWFNYCLTL